MRPARLDDYEALMELARRSGAGFTSLPVDAEILQDKLDKSTKAFSGQLEQPHHGKYLLIMEHVESGEVAGCSAVKAGTGISGPFFNYRIITLAQASTATETRYDMDALVLTNEYVGFTEVGTLFLKKEHRGGGAGRLAAQSRYLLMACAPELFSDRVLAELRGVIDGEGNTPFWDALGQHFFRMSFQEADYLSATTDNRFILDLMPKYPIYIDLLPSEAREVIGRCHNEGIGAFKLLEWEGFRFQRTVDIFDGGPLMEARRDYIRTFRESTHITVDLGDASGATGLVTNDRLEDFRSMLIEGEFTKDNKLILSAEHLNILGLKPGETARVWRRS